MTKHKADCTPEEWLEIRRYQIAYRDKHRKKLYAYWREYKREKRKSGNTWVSDSREYGSWVNMRDRCYNKKNTAYKNYGGRGITVCKEWRDSFVQFMGDMGPMPTQDHEIERRDNNGNYQPSNCQWASRHEQSRNKRNNVWLTYRGKTMCLADWSAEIGFSRSVIRYRNKAGWTDAETLGTPLRALCTRKT